MHLVKDLAHESRSMITQVSKSKYAETILVKGNPDGSAKYYRPKTKWTNTVREICGSKFKLFNDQDWLKIEENFIGAAKDIYQYQIEHVDKSLLHANITNAIDLTALPELNIDDKMLIKANPYRAIEEKASHDKF